MGIFGNLFGGDKQSAFKKFEKLYSKVFQSQVTTRDKDDRKAFLTRDLMDQRADVTKGGRAKLVLDYGTKGAKVEYTLAELNKMAEAGEKAQAQFKEDVVGVPIKDLLKASDRADITRAQLQISSATLYKVHGNLLHFRVSASKESDVAFHQVRIRLDSWDSESLGFSGGGYLQAAQRSAMGRISFNCDCGRHRYWYRYLATVGNFGLDPKEMVFPKIRNPGLKGCCCKHVIKTLATLRMHPIHLRLAKEMEEQAKKKGFLTRFFKGTAPQEKFIADDDLEKAGKDSSIAAMEKEFKTYQRAQKGFKKKQAEDRKKKVSPKIKQVKTKMKQTIDQEQADYDKAIDKIARELWMGAKDGVSPQDVLKGIASRQKVEYKELLNLAKGAKLI